MYFSYIQIVVPQSGNHNVLVVFVFCTRFMGEIFPHETVVKKTNNMVPIHVVKKKKKYHHASDHPKMGHVESVIGIQGGFPWTWGYPNSWMVYKGKILLTWMIWGYPYLGNLHIQ